MEFDTYLVIYLAFGKATLIQNLYTITFTFALKYLKKFRFI